MDPAGKQALEHVEFAEAEFAVLKQEQVLRELVSTGEPTVEATALLRQLREVVERLYAQREVEVLRDAETSTRKGSQSADRAA